MGLFIYVLLLFIWTSTCLNANRSNGSSTTVSPTGAKDFEPTTQTKMNDFRRHPYVHIAGITCTAFIIISFCFLHYNCLNDDFPKAEAIKKHVAAKLSKSSIMSFSKYKKDDLCIPEKQPMLSDVDKLSEPSGPEKSSSSSENRISSSSLENSSVLSSTENFNKTSNPKTVSRKSHRKCSLPKSHKLAHAHKLGRQVRSSHPNRAVRPPLLACLQYPLGPTETPCPTCLQNQIPLLKSSSLQKYTKFPRHPNLKRSFSTSMVDMLSKSEIVNSGQFSGGKCFVCRNISKSLVNDTSETKKTNAKNPPLSCEMKPFPKSFNKADSKDNAFYGNDGDSEREITIICE
ncbi:uncharacterized protein CXorf66 homolog [Pteronotus mesoamericanus]|uniref:uncharacterized protein CXorf66 homolog n=1 Tax=Pteronotus mesoamericanus TaxID=1884717 RepID=UPI0023ED8F8C|nr:uncharacterized protein CXorf66 homolog [Pteronotus parnellii mesoamericanus]